MKQPIEILQQYWGFSNFRSLQEDIIAAVLSGKDTLALMPTGGGKSVCFQVPALCMEGMCLVVSPLIALMKDQVQHLTQKGIPAVAIYAGMHPAEMDRLLDNCAAGAYRFLYLSPERLLHDLTRERLRRMDVRLIAVDEAHCISQWGYDFRPPYLRIAEIRPFFEKTPVLALTATATPEVVIDIQEKLGFPAPNVFQQGFERKNLAYVVLHEEGKETKMLDILRKVQGSAVVYTRNRRKSVQLAHWLQQRGISAACYHAGMPAEERSRHQDAWIAGSIRVMVSTNAFGMGIDKPDVRTVIHLDLPDSLEAYFQEAGRAGRDGAKSFAVLLYHPADAEALLEQLDRSFPDLKQIRQVYQALSSYLQLATGAGAGQSFDFELAPFAATYRLNQVETFHCLRILEQEGWIALSDAVVQPAMVRILLGKTQLYDYQLKNKPLDSLIRTLLRGYDGAFMHPVAISEQKLADFLRIPTDTVRKQLRFLHQEQVVDYRPAKDKPQLTLLQEMVPAANFAIDIKAYQSRRQKALHRIQSAINYADNPQCRSAALLAYFGETNAPLCGICDVCLSKKREAGDDAFERYRVKIGQILSQEPLTLDHLIEAFSAHRREQVLSVVQYLIDEGRIILEAETLRWKA